LITGVTTEREEGNISRSSVNKYRRNCASHPDPEVRVILHGKREQTKYREKAGVTVE